MPAFQETWNLCVLAKKHVCGRIVSKTCFSWWCAFGGSRSMWKGLSCPFSSLDTTNIYWQGQAYFRGVVKTIHAYCLYLAPLTWRILSYPRAKSTGNNKILWWFILCVNFTCQVSPLNPKPGVGILVFCTSGWHLYSADFIKERGFFDHASGLIQSVERP